MRISVTLNIRQNLNILRDALWGGGESNLALLSKILRFLGGVHLHREIDIRDEFGKSIQFFQ
jgi:hypothetical protein